MKHYVWGEWRSDQELQEIAREMNKRTVEQKLYKEVFRKLLGEVKETKASIKGLADFHS
jgi:hypothetical protein